MPALPALTTNTSTAAQRWQGSYARGHLPEVAVAVRGTFDSGTVTIEYSPDGTNWIADGELAFTAAGAGVFRIHPKWSYRATLAGAGSPNVVVAFDL